MKFVRFLNEQNRSTIAVEKEGIYFEIEGDMFRQFTITNKEIKIDNVRILPPCLPSKIVAVGLNYKDHAKEMNKQPHDEPMLFLKPSTTVIATEENIVYPKHMSSRVDYEGELAVVIGKEAHMVKEEESMDYVFGYTCINDITARDLQAKDIQFTRGKGFNTFAPIGPFIETELDPSNTKISTYLNNERKQHSNTKNLIFGVPKLVSFISSVMTLLPGDIISTGTPSGISPMKPGDVVEVKVEGIGTLKNQVV